ncbi:MAG: Phosphoribosylformylglycinamidine synthase [Cenarchaeum symbiont of Oopsacas minuta]|nr:Phosphoribosylformylglycinamidine synthase [Cenarchaeum symbiont of Oopsacas minuta]
MGIFIAKVVIENKTGINDPEGETILHDLILKGSNSKILDVRTAKILFISIRERSSESAKKSIKKMCDDMRIYNPMVSRVSISVSKA